MNDSHSQLFYKSYGFAPIEHGSRDQNGIEACNSKLKILLYLNQRFDYIIFLKQF